MPGNTETLSPLAPSRWLSTTIAVDRASYVASGFALMAVKYAIEALIVYALARVLWPPWVFLGPVASFRAEALGEMHGALVDPEWVLALLAVLSMPFLAIGLSMSVRRASDAGLSPWLGLLFAVPILNYLVMLTLSIAPSQPRAATTRPSLVAEQDRGAVRAALLGVLAAAGVGVGVVFVASDRLGLYGMTVFFVLPIAMGALAGFVVNRDRDRGVGLTLATAVAATLVTGGALLLVAIEGAVCVMMAAPIALVAVCVGALIGRVIAGFSTSTASGIPPALGCLVLLPTFAGIEHAAAPPIVYEVRSSVMVEAPPEVVWDRVIGFPELPPATEWYFHSGIAVPLSARIEGAGVGAVRHCEFSTGAFVEPITAWEPGRRLSFDVASQPPPMEEWSPYRHLHPPHLDASLRSVRGEFRLVPLGDARTRLEGSTWYTLNLAPALYFRLWSDAVIHRVHQRVLDHVRRLAEADARERLARAP